MPGQGADSLALRAFLGYRVDAGTPVRQGGPGRPDHSSLSRTRNRIDLETHPAVFDPGAPGLTRLTEQGLLKGQTLGIDARTLAADAALQSLVRQDHGQPPATAWGACQTLTSPAGRVRGADLRAPARRGWTMAACGGCGSRGG